MRLTARKVHRVMMSKNKANWLTIGKRQALGQKAREYLLFQQDLNPRYDWQSARVRMISLKKWSSIWIRETRRILQVKKPFYRSTIWFLESLLIKGTSTKWAISRWKAKPFWQRAKRRPCLSLRHSSNLINWRTKNCWISSACRGSEPTSRLIIGSICEKWRRWLPDSPCRRDWRQIYCSMTILTIYWQCDIEFIFEITLRRGRRRRWRRKVSERRRRDLAWRVRSLRLLWTLKLWRIRTVASSSTKIRRSSNSRSRSFSSSSSIPAGSTRSSSSTEPSRKSPLPPTSKYAI